MATAANASRRVATPASLKSAQPKGGTTTPKLN